VFFDGTAAKNLSENFSAEMGFHKLIPGLFGALQTLEADFALLVAVRLDT
jgi:hypothetical protein